MNALVVLVALFVYLTAPSKDHVRSGIDLADRGRIDCRLSAADGRKTVHGSGYHEDIDIDYHSNDNAVSCQSLVLAAIHRPLATELTLNRLDSFAQRVRASIEQHFAQRIQLWTVSVFHSDDGLRSKILTAVKVELAERKLLLAQQAPQNRILSAEVSSLPDTCRQLDFKDRSTGYLLIIETDSEASALRAAACTAEGWMWL
ncbi:MAG: hypothetical protein M3Q07_06075 [Pseudobdellovibrionaceae bacterium]|nr:hypothetical protein [Pseudobdellovibrionaceae bacterium]